MRRFYQKSAEGAIEAWDGADFDGAKGAVLWRGELVALLRDDRPEISWPGAWDLPGGGREGEESPFETFCREAAEEIGMDLTQGVLLWQRFYPSARPVWFLVVQMPDAALPPRLGEEGQAVALMAPEAFVAQEGAIPHLQHRMMQFLQDSA